MRELTTALTPPHHICTPYHRNKPPTLPVRKSLLRAGGPVTPQPGRSRGGHTTEDNFFSDKCPGCSRGRVTRHSCVTAARSAAPPGGDPIPPRRKLRRVSAAPNPELPPRGAPRARGSLAPLRDRQFDWVPGSTTRSVSPWGALFSLPKFSKRVLPLQVFGRKKFRNPRYS